MKPSNIDMAEYLNHWTERKARLQRELADQYQLISEMRRDTTIPDKIIDEELEEVVELLKEAIVRADQEITSIEESEIS